MRRLRSEAEPGARRRAANAALSNAMTTSRRPGQLPAENDEDGWPVIERAARLPWHRRAEPTLQRGLPFRRGQSSEACPVGKGDDCPS